MFDGRCTRRSARTKRIRDVAVAAHDRVSIVHPFGIEARPVWIDATPERGMTLHAVPLRVTRRAALQLLARRLSMLEEPQRLRVVKGRAQSPLRAEPDVLVAVLAEPLRVVTGRALERSAVRLGGVAGDEVGNVKAPPPFPVVAIGAEAALVTARAVELLARRRAAVRRQEAWQVHAHLTCPERVVGEQRSARVSTYRSDRARADAWVVSRRWTSGGSSMRIARPS